MLELYDRIKLQLLLCHIAYTPRTTWLQMNGGDSANKLTRRRQHLDNVNL